MAMDPEATVASKMREIKALAKRFTPEQIEGCITQQVETGTNVCLKDAASELIMEELSKAEYVRELMDGGMSLADALRHLARQIRRLQTGYGSAKPSD